MRLFASAALFALITAAAHAVGTGALVATQPVESAPFDVLLPEKVGLLEAGEHRELAFQVSGRLEMAVEEGVHVRAGEAVAALDSKLEVAQLRQAELRLRDARSQRRRLRGLRASDAASERGLESAETQVELRQAELDAAREQLDRRSLLAPFAGVVAHLYFDPDEIVSPGAPVALFIDVTQLRLEVGVPGYQVSQLAEGARALVDVPAVGGDPVPGTVQRVAPAAAVGRHLFEVEIRIDNPEGRLKPGMSARARIVLESLPEAVLLPLGAVVERAGERMVFFVSDGRAHAVPVDDAILQGERLVLRRTPGFRDLAVRGQRDLRHGMAVRVDNTVLGEVGEPAAAGAHP